MLKQMLLVAERIFTGWSIVQSVDEEHLRWVSTRAVTANHLKLVDVYVKYNLQF
jgi:hypothetical protein